MLAQLPDQFLVELLARQRGRLGYLREDWLVVLLDIKQAKWGKLDLRESWLVNKVTLTTKECARLILQCSQSQQSLLRLQHLWLLAQDSQDQQKLSINFNNCYNPKLSRHCRQSHNHQRLLQLLKASSHSDQALLERPALSLAHCGQSLRCQKFQKDLK